MFYNLSLFLFVPHEHLHKGEARSIGLLEHKAVLFVLISALFFANTGYSEEQTQSPQTAPSSNTIAVLHFENNSFMNKDAYDGLKKGLADMLTTELMKISSLHVLEREKLAAVLMEQELAQSDITDPAGAPQIGKLLGAQLLMYGGFVRDMNNKIRIDVRMVKVESGEIIKAVEATGKERVLFKLIKKLSFKIAKELDADISRAEKKAIKGSDKINMKVMLVYSQGLEALDAGDKAAALNHFKIALRMDKSFKRAQNQIQKLEAKE